MFTLPTGCGDEGGPLDEEVVRAFGALVTPRISYEIDPFLTDAYQSLSGDGYKIAHTAISWAEIAPAFSVRNWKEVDIHIDQARRRGIELSLVVEFLHGAEVDLPGYLEDLGWAWDEPTLVRELSRFLRELKERTKGTVGYLWLGEGPDRYLERYPDDEGLLLSFYGVLADSARRIFPDAELGVVVSAAEVNRTGRADFIRALRDTLGALAISAYPEELLEELPTAAEALVVLRQAIEPWKEGPFAVVEMGYPSFANGGSLDSEQSEFAGAVGDWLHDWPSTLAFFCWSPIHDAGAVLADSLAMRRYPDDALSRERFSTILSTSSLRRLDGSRKPAREAFLEHRP